MRNRYFDYNSTTPIAVEVKKVMRAVEDEIFGNASSLHNRGREARELLEKSRKQIASFIGASPHEIYFTSGGTESNNWALKGLTHLKERNKKHIISAISEHSSVFGTLKFLEKRGWEVTYLDIDSTGRVNPEDLKKAIREDTAFISIMTANNETGAIQPIGKLSSIAGEKGILFHTDAVQALGKMPVNVNSPHVDLMSISAHKIYGPKGIGALFVRRGISLNPLLHGGGQEYGRRSGTESLPLIAGFAEACRLSAAGYDKEIKEMMDLKKVLYSGLKEQIKCLRLNSPIETSLPNTLNISLPGCESETLLLDLDSQGFHVSAGSACGSIGRKKSRVLKSMGLKPNEIFSALRISLGRDTNKEDVELLIEALAKIVRDFTD